MNVVNVNQQGLNVSETAAQLSLDHRKQSHMDWGYFGNWGGRPLYGFVLTLRYSRMRYIEFTQSQDIHHLMASMVNGFRCFGGVPTNVLTDRMNIVMLEQSGCALHFDQRFLEFAAYHGFVPCVRHSYRPETKGEIESTVRIVRQNLLPEITYGSLADLNHQAHAWMEDLNRQIHPTTREIPYRRLVQERLLPINEQFNCDKSDTEERHVRNLQD